MIQMKNDFLDSVGFINKNQAEYSILTDLYNACAGKYFLLQLKKLEDIKELYTDVVKYINENYKSFELMKFVLDEEGILSHEILNNVACSSLSDVDLFNMAIKLSSDKSFVLVKGNDTLVLMHNGEFDDKFKNLFADKQKMLEAEKEKKDIDQLEWVFEDFHMHRKFRGCEYVIAGKVCDDVSEQQLRNSIMDFLHKKTNLHIVPELCTSKTNDEESVDIGLIDSNKRVAIIEVKYFVKQGLFVSERKKAYDEKRFLDGYKQLDKYCVHLNEDNYDLHSAFLYMFYADQRPKEEVIADAEAYLEQYMSNAEGAICSEKFKNHYKMTYCDNMLDSQRVNKFEDEDVAKIGI